MKKSIVYIKIPRAGLGNCLLVWAHGLVFSKLNDLEIVTSRWNKFRWGAIFRREKNKRFYLGYFKETSWARISGIRLRMIFSASVYDPPIERIPDESKKMYVFTKRAPDNNLFKRLEPFQSFIKDEILNNLDIHLKEKYSHCAAPQIGVHVRRGDFKLGSPITPESFFIAAISEIRKSVNEDIPVTVFTDATPDEISELLSLKNISLANNKEDILDVLQLSKSHYLVLSQSSSFGYWAAFLSEAVVIIREDEWQKRIKLPEGRYKEVRTMTGDGIKEFLN